MSYGDFNFVQINSKHLLHILIKLVFTVNILCQHLCYLFSHNSTKNTEDLKGKRERERERGIERDGEREVEREKEREISYKTETIKSNGNK